MLEIFLGVASLAIAAAGLRQWILFRQDLGELRASREEARRHHEEDAPVLRERVTPAGIAHRLDGGNTDAPW